MFILITHLGLPGNEFHTLSAISPDFFFFYLIFATFIMSEGIFHSVFWA